MIDKSSRLLMSVLVVEGKCLILSITGIVTPSFDNKTFFSPKIEASHQHDTLTIFKIYSAFINQPTKGKHKTIPGLLSKREML
jgi:hypothetical protein